MAESFYGGRAGHDFTIYYCYESPDEMKKDFGKIDSHTPIGGYCLDKKGNLYRRMINNEALSLGNAAIMGITDLQNTFLYRDGANIILQPTHNIPTKILTMEDSSFTYCGISGGTDISVSMEDNKIKINHNSKSFIPTTAGTIPLSYGSEFEVPILGYDEQGHVSSKLTQKYKLPAAISYSAGTGISLNNNTISLNAATGNSLGGIKTGYTESGKNYAVKLDSNNKAYVTVPWANSGGTVTSVSVKVNGSVKGTVTSSGEIDLGTLATTDTTYSAGEGLTMESTTLNLGGTITKDLIIKGSVPISSPEQMKFGTMSKNFLESGNASYAYTFTTSDGETIKVNDGDRIYFHDGSSYGSPYFPRYTGPANYTLLHLHGLNWNNQNYDCKTTSFTMSDVTHDWYYVMPKKFNNITSIDLYISKEDWSEYDIQSDASYFYRYVKDKDGKTTIKEILKLTPTGKLSIYDEDSGKLFSLN